MRRLALLAGGAALCVATPVVAQQSDYDRAVAARLADEPLLAVILLENWLRDHPDDVDARLQYGYALLALGKLDLAEQAFAAVLAAAPDYRDASEGLALVRERRAGPLAELRKTVAVVDIALSDLDAPQSDWTEVGAGLALPIGARDTLEVKGTWFERFELEDVQLGALYTHRAGEKVWLRFGAAATPEADFRPEVSATTGIDYLVGSGTVLSFDIGWQDFPAEEVWSFRPGLTQYFGGGRFAVNVSARAVVAGDSDMLIGGSLRADFLPQDRSRLFIGVASGPETDLGVVRDTTSVYGGGEVPLSEAVSLLGSVSHEWREIGSDRTEARVGVKLSL